MTRRLAFAVVVALAIPLSAWAQDRNDAWGGRGFLNFNVGVQTMSPDFGYASTTPLWGGTARAGIDIPGKTGPAFDIGGGVRLVQNLGVGVTYSRYSKKRTATLTTTIPNPLAEFGYSGEPGTAVRQMALQRDEDAVHIQAMYRIPITKKMNVGLFGGPSYFRCLDDVISEFAFDGNLYLTGPYRVEFQNLNFTKITPTIDKDSSWGYNGGADVSYLFTRHVGLGTTVRYSRASHTGVNHFANPNAEQLDWNLEWTPDILSGLPADVSQSVTMKHGGFHWNGGVTVRF